MKMTSIDLSQKYNFDRFYKSLTINISGQSYVLRSCCCQKWYSFVTWRERLMMMTTRCTMYWVGTSHVRRPTSVNSNIGDTTIQQYGTSSSLGMFRTLEIFYGMYNCPIQRGHRSLTRQGKKCRNLYENLKGKNTQELFVNVFRRERIKASYKNF